MITFGSLHCFIRSIQHKKNMHTKEFIHSRSWRNKKLEDEIHSIGMFYSLLRAVFPGKKEHQLMSTTRYKWCHLTRLHFEISTEMKLTALNRRWAHAHHISFWNRKVSKFDCRLSVLYIQAKIKKLVLKFLTVYSSWTEQQPTQLSLQLSMPNQTTTGWRYAAHVVRISFT